MLISSSQVNLRGHFVILFTLGVLVFASVNASTEETTRTFNDKETKLLQKGEMSTSRYVTGGIVGTLGFGLGHAVQGRYLERGWIFTLGQTASVLALGATSVGAFVSCIDGCSDSAAIAPSLAVLAFAGFYIWEKIDLWLVPPRRNRKIRTLKKRRSATSQLRPSIIADRHMVGGSVFFRF